MVLLPHDFESCASANSATRPNPADTTIACDCRARKQSSSTTPAKGLLDYILLRLLLQRKKTSSRDNFGRFRKGLYFWASARCCLLALARAAPRLIAFFASLPRPRSSRSLRVERKDFSSSTSRCGLARLLLSIW